MNFPILLASLFFQTDVRFTDSNDCGPNCLFVAIIAQAQNSSVSLLDVQKAIPASKKGCSLGDLAQAAEQLGCNAQSVKTSLECLESRAKPFSCIAHLSTGHFVLLSAITDSTVDVIDPPQTFTMPRSQFEASWSRNCLLISNRVLEPEEAIAKRLMTMRWIWRAVYGAAAAAAVLCLFFIWRYMERRRS